MFFQSKEYDYAELPGLASSPQPRRKSCLGRYGITLLVAWNACVTLGLVSCLLPGKTMPSMNTDAQASSISPVPAVDIHSPLAGSPLPDVTTTDLVVSPTPDTLSLSTDTRLEARAGGWTQTRLVVRGVQLVAAPGLSGIGLWMLYGDCKTYSDDKSQGEVGAKCVLGAIASVIGGAGMIEGTYSAIAWLKVAGLTWATGENPSNPVKRDMQPAEDILSRSLGSQVRYIGHTATDDLARRDGVPETAPVFSTTLNNTDVHFTWTRDADNTTRIRMGLGSGIDEHDSNNSNNNNNKNNRRLVARESYNKQYFSKGGFDIVARWNPEIPGEPSNDIHFNSNSQSDYDHIYQQVECQLKGDMNPDAASALYGINFEVKDHSRGKTLFAGAIAPFSDTTPSSINTMKIQSNLAEDPMCMA